MDPSEGSCAGTSAGKPVVISDGCSFGEVGLELGPGIGEPAWAGVDAAPPGRAGEPYPIANIRPFVDRLPGTYET